MLTWSSKAGVLMAAIAMVPGVVSGCSCGDVSGTGGDTASGGAGSGGGGSIGDGGSGGNGGSGGSLGEGGDGMGFGGLGIGGGLMGSGGRDRCVGLECQQVACPNGAKTTVSGTVYDPAGRVPLYNVIVYVPNAELDPIIDGATCDRCSTTLSGSPIATALTDTHGRFVLENVPVGRNIPLVVQVGKWRRQVTLPAVEACTDTPTEAGTIRLPRNQDEGHIPKIALTTGGADSLECLLHKLGIDEREFTPETGTGRINLFAGLGDAGHPVTTRYADRLNDGAAFTPAVDFWGSVDNLMKYDMVILSCEGDPYKATKPDSARKALVDYAAAGGRVFASHWHNYWLQAEIGRFSETAVWSNTPRSYSAPITALVDTTFPKGEALSDWLYNVGASTVPGQLEIHEAKHTVTAVADELATRWIYYEEPEQAEPIGVKYLTFNTPVGEAEENLCGRVVFTDIHVSTSLLAGPPFPEGCGDGRSELTPQEKALLFMLFDLSACITPDDKEPPIPPPAIPH